MQPRRPSDQKIPDIKYVRVITKFLGLLGLDTCRTINPYPPPAQYPNSPAYKPYYFGMGLKECKDYVEQKYDYYHTPEPYNPFREIQRGNIIAEVKATRRFMSMLDKLGVPSAGLRSGLLVCKQYVERRRAAR